MNHINKKVPQTIKFTNRKIHPFEVFDYVSECSTEYMKVINFNSIMNCFPIITRLSLNNTWLFNFCGGSMSAIYNDNNMQKNLMEILVVKIFII